MNFQINKDIKEITNMNNTTKQVYLSGFAISTIFLFLYTIIWYFWIGGNFNHCFASFRWYVLIPITLQYFYSFMVFLASKLLPKIPSDKFWLDELKAIILCLVYAGYYFSIYYVYQSIPFMTCTFAIALMLSSLHRKLKYIVTQAIIEVIVFVISNFKLFTTSKYTLEDFPHPVKVILGTSIFLLLFLFVFILGTVKSSLTSAKEQAEENEKLKSVFLSTVSKDLEHLIHNIISLNELILREHPEKPIKVYSEAIDKSGRKINKMILDMTDFAKISSSRLTLIPVSYSVVNFSRECSKEITEILSDGGSSFEMKVSPNLPSSLFGDRERISRLLIGFWGLLSAYAPSTSFRLIIDSEPIDAENINLKFIISSPAIKTDQKSYKVFLDFYKNISHDDSIADFRLKVITSLFEDLNATFLFNSDANNDSQIIFTVPQPIVDSTAIGDISLDAGDLISLPSESFHAPQAKLLLIDPSKANQNIIKALLAPTQIKIDTSDQMPEITNLLMQKRYNIILVDDDIARSSEVKTIMKLLHIDSPNKSTPIILLSAESVSSEILSAEGYVDCFTKPYSAAALEKTLLGYLPEDIVTK